MGDGKEYLRLEGKSEGCRLMLHLPIAAISLAENRVRLESPVRGLF